MSMSCDNCGNWKCVRGKYKCEDNNWWKWKEIDKSKDSLRCSVCEKEYPDEAFTKGANKYEREKRRGRQSRCKRCRAKTRSDYEKGLYRERNIKKLYGITVDQFNAMLIRQEGKCAICGTTEPGGKGNFFVDHCHETGKIRELLCLHCNSAIGYFRDNISYMQKGIDYINKHK